MTQLLPPKKEVALALLERSNVDIYLDPRAKGVVVPPQFRKEPRLILKIGLNMPVPIPDLRLDDESMSCTLSFNRSPFYCVVPWGSVFAMVGDDGRGMVWPDDVPQELSVRVAEEQSMASQERRDAPAPSSAGRGKGRARPVDASAAGAGSTPDSDRAGGKGKRGKKKKDEPTRPMLVAVPNLPREPREEERPSDARPAAKDKTSEAALEKADKGGDRSEKDAELATGAPASTPAAASAPRVDASEPASTRAPESRPDEARDREKEHAARPPGRPLPPPGASPPSSRGPQSRPKRELPPYLRVVK